MTSIRAWTELKTYLVNVIAANEDIYNDSMNEIYLIRNTELHGILHKMQKEEEREWHQNKQG